MQHNKDTNYSHTHFFLLVIVITLYMCHYITSNNCTKSGTKMCRVIGILRLIENKNGLYGFNSPWGFKEIPERTGWSYKVLVRPENIRVDPTGVEAVVLNNVYVSGQKLVKCRVSDRFTIYVKTDDEFNVGQIIRLQLNVSDIEILLDRSE